MTDSLRRHVDENNAQPTGLPSTDPLESAQAINAQIGHMINLPGNNTTGLLHRPGQGDAIGHLAQVSIALSLADIAASLRRMPVYGRPADEEAQG